jgi:hypothetical protein
MISMEEQPNPELPDVAQYPSVMVSDAFINFMHRRDELSSFVKFYHKLAQQAIQPSKKRPNKELYKEYRGNSVFFLENYISRISDFFDIYIDDLIYSVCLTKKDFLSERDYVKAQSRFEKRGFSNLTDDDVLFEASIALGRKDKSEIAEHFKKMTGFDIIKAAGHWEEMLLCNRIRNLIVHKGSIMDERFIEFVKDKDCPFEVELGAPLIMPEKWVLELASKVDRCISAVDDAISHFVPIHKRNRYGHFWLPRSTWANPLTSTQDQVS